MEEKKKNRIGWLPVALLIPILVLAVAVIVLALPKGGAADQNAEKQENSDALSLSERSLLMTKGETRTLTVAGTDVTLTSSNPEVASVSEDGTVTALAVGSALITAASGEETAYCGVIVDGAGKLIDMTGMKANAFIEDMELFQPLLDVYKRQGRY